jgi:hypothetical protein
MAEQSTLLKRLILLDLMSFVLIVSLAYLGPSIHSFVRSLLHHILHSSYSTTCLLSLF